MKRWYIVQTYSGFESSIISDLNTRRNTMNLQDKIFRIISPEEEYVETKVDKKTKQEVQVIKKRRRYPGYIFVEIEIEKEIDDETWYIIRNTPKVTGILGSSGKGIKPVPVSNREMREILGHEGYVVEEKSEFEVGDLVEITNGAFKESKGFISKINLEKREVEVMLELFGRQTPTVLNFRDIKKTF